MKIIMNTINIERINENKKIINEGNIQSNLSKQKECKRI